MLRDDGCDAITRDSAAHLVENNGRSLCCRRAPYHLWELWAVNCFERFHHIIVSEFARRLPGSSCRVHGNVVHRQDSLKLAGCTQNRQTPHFSLRHSSQSRANIILGRARKDFAQRYLANRDITRQPIPRSQGDAQIPISHNANDLLLRINDRQNPAVTVP
jgi:hypothetical protein